MNYDVIDRIETIQKDLGVNPQFRTFDHLRALKAAVRCGTKNHFSNETRGCIVDDRYGYRTEGQTVAHELEHFLRFKEAVNKAPFVAFVSGINELSLPIAAAQDAEAAVREIQGRRGAYSYHKAKAELRDAAELANNKDIPHPDPQTFTDASLNALKFFLDRIDERRKDCPLIIDTRPGN